MITRQPFWTSLTCAFRRTALPLAAYYAVTLVLPIANGAARTGGPFFRHALVVLAVPPVVVALVCTVRALPRPRTFKPPG